VLEFGWELEGIDWVEILVDAVDFVFSCVIGEGLGR